MTSKTMVLYYMTTFGKKLTVILRGHAGSELIYITNEAVGLVGYYQLISGKSEKNNCFSKFSSNSLDFFGWNLLKWWHFFTDDATKKIFPTSNISEQEIRHQFFLIWSNLTIMAHIMAEGTDQKAGKSLSWAKNLLMDVIIGMIFLYSFVVCQINIYI